MANSNKLDFFKPSGEPLQKLSGASSPEGATPTWWTGFEHGVFSVNGGGIFNTSGGTGTASVVTTKKNTGTYALQIACTANFRYVTRTISGNPANFVGRFYFQIDSSLPAQDMEICSIDLASGVWISIYFESTNSKIGVGIQTGSVGTPVYSANTISANTWYCIDFYANISGATWTVDWSIDGTAQTQFTHASAATSVNGLTFGPDTTITKTLYIDDIICSATAGDYPFGVGGTEGIVPTSDGTHNAGVNTMENQAGADIGAVAAWSLIDELPMNSTADYIRQFTLDTGKYAEVNFGDPVNNTGIFGVMGVLAYMSSGTAANQGAAIISSDGFVTSTTVWGNPTTRADYSESSLFYKNAAITEPGGGWTSTTLNALKARMGYSGDVTPNPQWHAIMCEVAYSTATPPPAPGASHLYTLLGVGG